MISDLDRDMEDLFQNKDKNKIKRKIQKIKDRLISDLQYLNLVQDQDTNEEDEEEDTVETIPHGETEEPPQSSQSSIEEEAWDVALSMLSDPLEFPAEFLHDLYAEAERKSDQEFEDKMGFPFRGLRYDPECSFPKA